MIQISNMFDLTVNNQLMKRVWGEGNHLTACAQPCLKTHLISLGRKHQLRAKLAALLPSSKKPHLSQRHWTQNRQVGLVFFVPPQEMCERATSPLQRPNRKIAKTRAECLRLLKAMVLFFFAISLVGLGEGGVVGMFCLF